MQIGLARLLLSKPSLLLLDEPSNHLDSAARDWLGKYIAKYDGSVVLVSHDRRAVLELATKAVWLENGHVKMIGNPEEVVAAYEAN